MGLKQSVLAEMFHDLGLDPTHAHTIKDIEKSGHFSTPIPSHSLRRGEEVHPAPVRSGLVEIPKKKEEPKVEPVEMKAEEPVAAEEPAVEVEADAEKAKPKKWKK